MKNQRSRQGRPDSDSSVPRSQLAALYEADHTAAGGAADAELCSLRDSVREWVNEPPTPDRRARLRRALLQASRDTAADEVNVAPVSGFTWILRKGSDRPIPVSSVIGTDAGTRVAVPDGSRAQFHYHDGSIVLVDGGSEIEVGKLGRGNNAARLGRGRLFAWVAPQSGGAFGVRTPHGSVSVVGTEFDLGISATGSLDLVVAGGTVRFSPRDADAGESRSLTAGNWLSLTSGSSTVRSLTPSQLRNKTEWARNGGPKHEGTGWWKIIVVLLIVVTGMLVFLRREDLGLSTNAGNKHSAMPLAKGVPYPVVPVQFAGDEATFGLPLVTGTGQVLTVEIDALQGSKYAREHNFTASCRSVESRPDGSVKITWAIRDDKSGLVAEGFEMWIHPDGSVDGIRVAGKDTIDGESVLLCMNLAVYSWERLLPDKPVRPGDTYERGITATFDQHPSARFGNKETVRYDGFVTEGGVTLAKFSFASSGTADGILGREQRAYGRLQQTRLDKLERAGTGVFYVDAKTGRIVRRDSQDKTIQTIATYALADGKLTGPVSPRVVVDTSRTRVEETQ